MLNRNEILEKLKKELEAERFKHSLRVEKIALKLGEKYRVNKNQIAAAALLHDCARRYDRRGLLKKARLIGLKIDPIRKFEPKLFHAEISAHLARTEFGIRSAKVLRAIRRHTTGAVKMSELEKIVYLADHIEEERGFAGVEKIRKLAFKNLDQAVFEAASNMLRFLLKNKLPIYPDTVRTRNSALQRLL